MRKKRGANIRAELAGYGLSSDAYHYTRPDPDGDGSARAMTLALADAGIDCRQVSYINAHGTGTESNDRIETLAIRSAFKKAANAVAVSSTKSMLGHMLGAAGAVEAGIAAMAIEQGIIPPTINLDHPDPACGLDHVRNKARKARVSVALSNSLGFGGMNAALLLKRLL